jgi:transcriptional regulator with GAF, ATPase, and Fis domain
MPAFSSERLAETFVEVADTLVADFDVVDFLTVVAERAVELSDASTAGLLLADERGLLRFVAASTESAGVVDLFQVEQEEGPGQDCYRLGRPVTHADLGRAGAEWPVFGPRAVEVGFASVHAFPLRHGAAVLGALTLFGSRSGVVAAEAPRIVQALADIATIGLLQHQTIARGELLTGQLQQALNSRVTIEQAKGALTQLRGVDPDAAFGMLRTYSRNNHHRLTDVASAVLKDPASHPELTARH